MTNGTKVLKRDGQTESLNLEKVHKMTEEACEGLAGVSASQVEIQSWNKHSRDSRNSCKVCIRFN